QGSERAGILGLEVEGGVDAGNAGVESGGLALGRPGSADPGDREGHVVGHVLGAAGERAVELERAELARRRLRQAGELERLAGVLGADVELGVETRLSAQVSDRGAAPD